MRIAEREWISSFFDRTTNPLLPGVVLVKYEVFGLNAGLGSARARPGKWLKGVDQEQRMERTTADVQRWGCGDGVAGKGDGSRAGSDVRRKVKCGPHAGTLGAEQRVHMSLCGVRLTRPSMSIPIFGYLQVNATSARRQRACSSASACDR